MTTHVNLWDIWGKETRRNPQPIYEEMRAEAPVYRAIGPVTGNPFWFITRYDDCIAVLKHQHIGKDLWTKLTPEQYAPYGSPPAADNPLSAVDRHLLNMDPPDHTRLRALVHKAFTPRIVENLRPRIQAIADNLIDNMLDNGGEVDFINSYAFPLPITVIAEMLGVSPEDRDRFREWTRALLFNMDQESATAAALEFVMYMHTQIDERHENPRDDVLSALVNAEEEGDRLDRQELLSMIFLLLVAGHETTVNLIGNGTLALLQHPDQMQKLNDEPGLIRTAVEEILRYNGPVETTTIRWTFEDVAIGGVVIPVGEVVLPVLLAANRDPAHFENPNTFDITRDPNKHIAFGNGIHYCVGAPLARLEGAIAINTMLRRLPNLQLNADPDTLDWSDNILLHGLQSLPVRV